MGEEKWSSKRAVALSATEKSTATINSEKRHHSFYDRSSLFSGIRRKTMLNGSIIKCVTTSNKHAGNTWWRGNNDRWQ